MIRLKPLVFLTIVLLATFSVSGGAQLGPSRAAGTFGFLAFQGTRGEKGVGVGAAAQITISSTTVRRFALEAGFHTLSGFAIWESPDSPVWHARMLASTRIARPFYLTAGLGAYVPVGPAGRATGPALGLDLGLGLRFSSHATLEGRYLSLRTTRLLGWALPISIMLGL
jgi:hypothetical protein